MKSLRTLLFVSIALLGMVSSASGQGWVATYTPGVNKRASPRRLVVDADGNTYVAGYRANIADRFDTLCSNTTLLVRWFGQQPMQATRIPPDF